MINLLRPVSFFLFVQLLFAGFVWGNNGSDRALVLTHADAAVILAKYSGFFDRYVDENAGLNKCVGFLNKTGIYFGLMEVVNQSEFTVEDCARSLGQVDLVLSGEAEFVAGKVKLPKGIESWKDFCIMNEVKYVEGHQAMLDFLNVAHAQR